MPSSPPDPLVVWLAPFAALFTRPIFDRVLVPVEGALPSVHRRHGRSGAAPPGGMG